MVRYLVWLANCDTRLERMLSSIDRRDGKFCGVFDGFKNNILTSFFFNGAPREE